MTTRTLELENEIQKPSAPTSLISGQTYSFEYAGGYTAAPMDIRSIHRQTWSLGGLGFWLLALTTITTPIVYVDPRRDLLRSGSSVIWSARRRAGRQISLR